MSIQADIDRLRDVLLAPDRSDSTFGQTLRELRRLCRVHGLIPTSVPKHVALTQEQPISQLPNSDIYIGRLGTQDVALKVLRPHGDEAAELKRAYANELVIWQSLRHPNIVPFLGTSSNFDISLISKWMSGGTVLAFLKTHPNSIRMKLVNDLIRGLAFMHSLDIVHGDIKGPNVLVDDAGNARLTDFGLTNIVHATQATSLRGVGSTQWMAPELLDYEADKLDDGHPTKKSDLYALAITVWQIFSEKIPFHGVQSLKISNGVLKGLRPPRCVEITLEHGLSDDVWNRMVSWWQHFPSKRPDLIENDLSSAFVVTEQQLSRLNSVITQPNEDPLTQSQSPRLEQDCLVLQQAIDDLFREIMSMQPRSARYAQEVWRLRQLCRENNLIPTSCQVPQEAIVYSRTVQSLDGFSDIYQGHIDGRKVAIKVLSLRVHMDYIEDIRKAYLHELVIWVCLRHNNIVPFIGVSAIFDFALLSEWMQGGPIREYLEEHPGGNRRRYVLDVIRGLAYMHSLNVVHGDVQSKSVLVDGTGCARLGNFELGVILQSNDISSVVSGTGTLRWMAPELLESNGGKATVESDLYALALTAWEIFSGEIPFKNMMDFKVLSHVLHGGRPLRNAQVTAERGLSDDMWARMCNWWDAQPERRIALSDEEEK